MGVVLGENSYGKSRVRLVRVTRGAERHELADYTVAVAFEGDYEAAHVQGDNAAVLPTDTMKNTVYALAKREPVSPPEGFAAALVRHFLGASEAARRVRVEIQAHAWRRLPEEGGGHPHAFVRAGGDRRIAVVAGTREGIVVEAGVAELQVLKTTGSAFSGFPRDPYTTLAETEDRIFATAVDARWRYGDAPADFDDAYRRARAALLGTFADHDSKSVQHTLYAMGEAALGAVPEMEEIRLSLPNRHHLRVDLSPFGLENDDEVFVATEEPHGLIEATLWRDEELTD